MRFANQQSGYSLIETLVAISILLLSIIGPMTIASKGIQSARYSGEQITATYLAQEGIETVIAIRNQAALDAVSRDVYTDVWDWTGNAGPGPINECIVNNLSSPGCNISLSEGSSNFDIDVQKCNSNNCDMYFDASRDKQKYHTDGTATELSKFNREIWVIENGGEAQVTVKVTWNSDLFIGSERDVTLTTSLFNIYDFTN